MTFEIVYSIYRFAINAYLKLSSPNVSIGVRTINKNAWIPDYYLGNDTTLKLATISNIVAACLIAVLIALSET